MTLFERTKTLLAERMSAGVNLRDIADASNGTVNYEWLKKFVALEKDEDKRIKNPGVNTIESLHNCLKKLSKPN